MAATILPVPVVTAPVPPRAEPVPAPVSVGRFTLARVATCTAAAAGAVESVASLKRPAAGAVSRVTGRLLSVPPPRRCKAWSAARVGALGVRVTVAMLAVATSPRFGARVNATVAGLTASVRPLLPSVADAIVRVAPALESVRSRISPVRVHTAPAARAAARFDRDR